MTTYSEKLKDPRWQRKRLEVLQRNDFHCEMCGGDDTTLHVHHKAYLKGREPWEYDAEQLTVLCEFCHDAQHQEEDPYNLVGSYLQMDGPCSRRDASALVLGFGCSLEVSNKFHTKLGWPEEEWALRLSDIGHLAQVIARCAYKVDTGFYDELAIAVYGDPEGFVKAAKNLISKDRERSRKGHKARA